MRIKLFLSCLISDKIYSLNFNKIKAFIISLIIHITLFMLLLYSSTQVVHLEPLKEEKKVISVSLVSSFEKSLVKTTTPKAVTPKPVVKKTVVKKQIVKKPVVQKPVVQKTIPKKTAVKKRETKTPLKTKAAPISKKISPQKEAIIPTKTLTPSEAFTPLTTEKPLANKAEKSSDKPEPPLQEKGISPTKLGQIRSLIQNSLVYPAIARRMKIEGVVVVSFLLTKDGHVEKANVHTPSGSRTLDAKALKTVLALSGEYPHLDKKTDLQIPISFSLKNS